MGYINISCHEGFSKHYYIHMYICMFDGVQRLYQLDARKFVIGNVGPIGCIPYQKTINQLKEDECVELPNKLALQYNARLKDLLAQLNENLPGALFVHANVYDLVLDLITNYKQHGNVYGAHT